MESNIIKLILKEINSNKSENDIKEQITKIIPSDKKYSDYDRSNEYVALVDDSPLHVAIEKNKIQILKFLLDSGGDVEKRAIFKGSLLDYAIKCNNIDSVKLLLNYGVNVNKKYSNYIPFDIAIENYNNKDSDLHVEQTYNFNPKSIPKLKQEYETSFDIIKLLLNHKTFDINLKGNREKTPIDSVIHLFPKIAKLLIKKGAIYTINPASIKPDILKCIKKYRYIKALN